MTLFGFRVPMMASLIVWALAWEIVGRLEIMFLIPPITSIFSAGIELVQTGSWQNASLITLRSFISAWRWRSASACRLAC